HEGVLAQERPEAVAGVGHAAILRGAGGRVRQAAGRRPVPEQLPQTTGRYTCSRSQSMASSRDPAPKHHPHRSGADTGAWVGTDVARVPGSGWAAMPLPFGGAWMVAL